MVNCTPPSTHFLSGLFVFMVLSCMSCLYILETNPLAVASFANIFSYSLCCLFTFFMVSFAVQKVLNLIRSHLFIFPLLWEVDWKRYCCNLYQTVFFLFSSKTFIIPLLTLRSLTDFEFIFECGVQDGSKFIFLHVDVQFSQHYLLKRLSFLHCIVLPSLL